MIFLNLGSKYLFKTFFVIKDRSCTQYKLSSDNEYIENKSYRLSNSLYFENITSVYREKLINYHNRFFVRPTKFENTLYSSSLFCILTMKDNIGTSGKDIEDFKKRIQIVINSTVESERNNNRNKLFGYNFNDEYYFSIQ